MSQRRPGAGALCLILAGLLLGASVLSLGVGASRQAPGAVLQALSDGLQTLLFRQPLPTDELHTVVLQLRLPRVLLGILVGSCLALAGAIMQALFQNALADPYILGVSSGAALGVIASRMLTGLLAGAGLLYSTPLAAFGGAVFVVFLVYALAQRGGRVQTGTLLLTGIAVGSLISAVTSFLMLVMDDDLRTVLFWLLGGLSGRSWPEVGMILPAAALGTIGAFLAQRPLNLLLFGDEAAASLGLNLALAKRLLLALASLLAAAAVAVSGIIAFVGLVVPHVTRLLVGPDHRALLPACLLAGALLMILSDMLARTLLAPAELPIGIITSALGCPFFLYLLHSQSRQGL